MKCHFTIYRFEPQVDQKPRYQEYEIDAEPTDKILDCLNKIRWEQDPTLAYRYSCAHGICGSARAARDHRDHRAGEAVRARTRC